MFDLQIKKYRNLRHLNQEQLALLCNLSPSYISRLEAGKLRKRSPTLSTVLDVAYALAVCPLDLISFDCNQCKLKDNCRKKDKEQSSTYDEDIEYYL